MYKLVIADDDGKTTVVPLVRDEITIGRKEGNTIRLTERNVSRRHAKLRKGDAGYLVEDLQSYNGVKVNGRRVGGEVVLKAGDQITIGDYQLALQMEDSSATIPETTAALPLPNSTLPHGGEPDTAVMAAPGHPTLPAGGMHSAAASPQPPARIVMTSQPAPGAEFALSRPMTRIGRAEELDVWINHRSISREHAEITNDNGTVRIKDLGSANGVRVNGRDTTQGELKPGDTVELGQVRFRFVGPGEQFVFDAERTMQLDAFTSERAPNRAPIYAAAGIVGLAMIAAVALAMSGGSGETVTAIPTEGTAATPTATAGVVATDPPTTPEAAAAVGPSADETIATAVAACVAARNSGNFEIALQRAGEALALRADDARALDCQRGAQQERAESDAFARGVASRDRGDLAGAYLAFDELPPRSSYRSRPEVAQTMRDFANATLERAQAVLASEPDEAQRLAQTVLNMTQVDAGTRRAADALARRARPRVASSGRDRDRGRQRETPRDTTPPAATPPVRPPPESGGGSAQGSGSSQPPMEAARECLARADNACVIRALENRARSEAEWRMLVETHRAMGNTPRMLDAMERYMARFPSGPRSSQYRQILLQHGR